MTFVGVKKKEPVVSGSMAEIVLFVLNLLLLMIGSWSEASTLFTFILFSFVSRLGNRPLLAVKASLYFGIYTLLAIILAYTQFVSIGSYFLGGGDDEFFWQASRTLAENKMNLDAYHENIPLSSLPYRGYLLVNGAYILILNTVGFGVVSFFDLVLLSCFISSFVPLVATKVFGAFIDVSVFKRVIPFIVVFNPSIIHVITLIRENWLVFFLFVQLAILTKNLNGWGKALGIACIIVAVAGFRPFHALMMGICALAYFFLATISKQLRFISLILLAVVVYLMYSNVDVFLSRSVEVTSEKYSELANQGAAGESIGLYIINAPGIAGDILRAVYVSFSPIPPPVFSVITFRTILQSVGQMSWYFVFIVFVFSARGLIRFYPNRPLVYSIYVTFVISSFAIGMSSNDPRHLQFLTPVIFVFTLGYLYSNKKILSLYLKIFAAAILLGALGYFMLKMFV